jgi:hypothetical protein
MSFAVEERAGSVRLRVKVQARAHREEIVGVHDGALRVRVTAPPVAGRANQAVVELLAERLRLPRSSVKITSGERSPQKTIEVAGLGAAAVLERLRLKSE